MADLKTVGDMDGDIVEKSDLLNQLRIDKHHREDSVGTRRWIWLGGAIALVHPLGATWTRLVITLLNELRRRKKKYGLATACIGGGQGIAMVVENFN